MLSRIFYFSITILLLIGCAPKHIPAPKEIDHGCERPPEYVFTAAGIDIEFARSTFGKVVTGDISIKANPQIFSLANKAVLDERIRNYLRCLLIKRDGYTPEQALYFDELSAIMRTNPTAREFLEWKKTNPFPKKMTDNSHSSATPTIIEQNFAHVDTVITLSDLKGGSIYTGNHYVNYKRKDSLDLQVGGVLYDDMVARFSIVSSGSGLYAVDRLFIKLHGYAVSNLRDEYPTAAAFMGVNAYQIQLFSDYDEYDLLPLRPFGRFAIWKYENQDFDEFFIKFSSDPYVLFVISFELRGRDLKNKKDVNHSSDLYKLIWVQNGNTGGALDLDRWYTPDKLRKPKRATYKNDLDDNLYRLLTVDLSRDSSYLDEIGKERLRTLLSGLQSAVETRPNNTVFQSNFEKIKEYVD